jgi:hypothetical protein
VNNNDVFAITYAGIGRTGKHEYHIIIIINNHSGTFLTYPEGVPDGKQRTGEVLSSSNNRTRWSVRHPLSRTAQTDPRRSQLVPHRNGSGQYWCVSNK